MHSSVAGHSERQNSRLCRTDFACDFETEWYSLRRVKGKGVSNRMSYYPNRLVDA